MRRGKEEEIVTSSYKAAVLLIVSLYYKVEPLYTAATVHTNVKVI